jgi:Mycolic acid cyclopropane synthetase
MMNHLGQALWQVLVPASIRNHNKSGANEHYQALRPHHLLLVYGLYKAVVVTGIWSRLTTSLQAMASNMTESFIPLVQAGWVPDCLIRFGIRLQLQHHLHILASTSTEDELEKKLSIIEQLKSMPIAIETDAANEQHYEVPAAFYQLTLGPHRKYSSGLWKNNKNNTTTSLEESERAMLELYCTRAGIIDNNNMHIVDLGCGWGSLTLYIAQHYPHVRITGISNSTSQREYILETAQQRGLNLNNIEIITVRLVFFCFVVIVRIPCVVSPTLSRGGGRVKNEEQDHESHPHNMVSLAGLPHLSNVSLCHSGMCPPLDTNNSLFLLSFSLLLFSAMLPMTRVPWTS